MGAAGDGARSHDEVKAPTEYSPESPSVSSLMTGIVHWVAGSASPAGPVRAQRVLAGARLGRQLRGEGDVHGLVGVVVPAARNGLPGPGVAGAARLLRLVGHARALPSARRDSAATVRRSWTAARGQFDPRPLVGDARGGDVLAEGGARLGGEVALAVPVDQPGHPLLGLQRAQRHLGDRADRAAHLAPGGVDDERHGGDRAAGSGAAGGLEEGLRGVQQRDADEGQQFAGPQRVHAGQQVADRDLPVGPPGPARMTLASSAASTGRASPVGAAETMLPPRVPALRICGGPAERAAAASAGMSAAKSGRPMRAWVRPAPSSAAPSAYCQPRISPIRPRPTSAAGRSSPALTDAIRSVPPATGTALGMAASAATASSSEDGNVTFSAACCAYVLTQLPLPGLPPSRGSRTVRADSPDVATLAHLPPGSARGSTKYRSVRHAGDRTSPRGENGTVPELPPFGGVLTALRVHGARLRRGLVRKLRARGHTIGGGPSFGRPRTPGRRCQGSGPPGGRYSTPRASSRA